MSARNARANPAETVRAVLHELRSRVGAIRLAVTTLQKDECDLELRTSLLDTADRETLRVSTEMMAVTALVAALTDRSPMQDINLMQALRSAATIADRVGVRASVGRGPRAFVRARPHGFDGALSSLMQLVADVDGETTATVSRKGKSLVVMLAREDGRRPAAGGSLIRGLLDGIGAKQVDAEGGLAFSFKEVSP
jgi:hypothetical protein